jgi:hypothetical protein
MFPGAQVHAPFVQADAFTHAAPHEPQLFVSLPRFTQLFEQFAWPEGQCATQVPSEHAGVLPEQTFVAPPPPVGALQPPQLLGSVEVSTQPVEHSVAVPEHWHWPAAQVAPEGH